MKTITYTSGNANDHKKVGQLLRELPDGQEYVIQIKRNRPVRSLSQNKYYFLCLNIIGLSTGHTTEELHEICKLKFNSDIIHFPKSGSQILGKTTSDLDSKEMTAYINRVKLWANDEFGIVIPEAQSMTNQRIMEIHNLYDDSVSGM